MNRAILALVAAMLLVSGGCTLTRGITEQDKAQVEQTLAEGAEASASLDKSLDVAEHGLEAAMAARDAAGDVIGEERAALLAARVEDARALVSALREQKAAVDAAMERLRADLAKAEEGTPIWLVVLQVLGTAAAGAAALGGPLAAKLRLASHALDTTVRGVQALRGFSQEAKTLTDSVMITNQDEAARRYIRQRKDKLGIKPAQPRAQPNPGPAQPRAQE